MLRYWVLGFALILAAQAGFDNSKEAANLTAAAEPLSGQFYIIK